jgi:CTP:molybdopterin cytidylyltransferase MocA
MKNSPSAPLRICVSALEPGVLSGLILAGGEGRRFGKAKAFAELPDGRSFLEACSATLRAAGAAPVVATLPRGTSDPGIGGLHVLPLPEPGMDMFGSLRVGLAHLITEPDWRVAAVLPVDHPLVRGETVRALAATGAGATIPSFNGKHGHPICMDRGLAEAVVGGEVAGGTLRNVLRAVGAVTVEVDDPGVVANCNTPAALSEALAQRTS